MQRGRQENTQEGRYTNTQADRLRDISHAREAGRQATTHRHTGRQTDKQSGREANTQAGKYTDANKHTKQTDREANTKAGRKSLTYFSQFLHLTVFCVFCSMCCLVGFLLCSYCQPVCVMYIFLSACLLCGYCPSD